MKILLKKEVCGSRDQYIGPTETLTTPIKHSKKKKKGNAGPKRVLNFFFRCMSRLIFK